jgi:hypothetical protein
MTLAVVVTDVGGIREAVREAAVLAPAGDAEGRQSLCVASSMMPRCVSD